ncbi:dienelactone hydrolase family protein [Cellulophaga sp. F20128]|uniref:dienelactone hydrolase family protein n=1 Tax=Cellulophaga sp. F20128 TaxID=2926413 RepID=UPI001FF5C611|nr:dienelactone hydrolase family protein [Cellulophaga sp. F20128]MCK0156598.1 dienelactone hydrolase family protein [Cellulophaga sp. F20128]
MHNTLCYKGLLSLFFLLSLATTKAQNNITKTDAVAITNKAIAQVTENNKERAAIEWKNKEINIKDKSLRFTYRVLGEKPIAGRSLYISMHGGGNTRPEMNDRQWKNQLHLYTPKEGVYVAPRAPTNTWNLWHENHIDDFLEQLIKNAIIMEGVNPNKVYIMGYSAGGDGVFQLAPRMADYWAAAAMMAGHPGDASILSLRNLPFAIYMGGKDGAYQRNEHAATWGAKLDSVQKIEPGHYIHDVQIYPEMPHWMSKKDTVAMPWMANFTRNPLPKKVSWHQDDRLHNRFYWLGVPNGNKGSHTEAIVSISGNTITVEKNDNPELYVYLNDQLLNLNKKVKVIYQGKQIFHNKVKRSASIIQETASRMDNDLVFYARLTLKEGEILF